MTIRERIVAALHGQMPDRVPFVTYPGSIPTGEMERKFRNAGLGMHQRIGIYRAYMKGVKICSEEYVENGKKFIKKSAYTPVGKVEERWRTGGAFGTNLRFQWYIKKPEDYRVVKFMIRNTIYSTNYDMFREVEKDMGGDGYVWGEIPYSPIPNMLIWLMGPEQFAIDWHEHRDLIDSLYGTILIKQRKLYRIAAESPAEVILYGDNITSEMIGLERFQNYCVNCYNEFASYLHPQGKLLAVHMDGRLDHLKQAIADSDVDVIEAFTPPPDGDLPLLEAKNLWKDKTLWINYPTTLHSRSTEEIKTYTLELLRQAEPGNNFVISNTENLTTGVWPTYTSTVLKVLEKHGRLPLSQKL